MIACRTQVAPGTLGAFDQIAARGLAEFNPDSVEEIFVCDPKTKLAQTFREFSSEIVEELGKSAKPRRNANITGGFVAPDVLRAYLENKSIGRTPFIVVENASEPAGKVTF